MTKAASFFSAWHRREKEYRKGGGPEPIQPTRRRKMGIRKRRTYNFGSASEGGASGLKSAGGPRSQATELFRSIPPTIRKQALLCCAIGLLASCIALACAPAFLLLWEVHKSDKYECPTSMVQEAGFLSLNQATAANRDGIGRAASGGAESKRCFSLSAAKGRNDTTNKVCLQEALSQLQGKQAYLPGEWPCLECG